LHGVAAGAQLERSPPDWFEETAMEKPPRKILLVDDEENVLSALRRTLRREPYDILLANGPEQALELLSQHQIDLVLSDHLMPRMTGLELLKIVRNRHPSAMRLILTGHADMQTAIDAINHGEIYRFLTKPWDDTELKVTLHLAFEQLDLELHNRHLLAMARAQRPPADRIDRASPLMRTIPRYARGYIVIDTDSIDLVETLEAC
jgi:DNA-binding NtrC family response regulator